MGVPSMSMTLVRMIVIVITAIEMAFQPVIPGARRMDFDLQRCMIDAEMLLQLMLGLGQEAVSRVSAGHDQMSCERRLRGADGPDMHMVNTGDARALGQCFLHIG